LEHSFIWGQLFYILVPFKHKCLLFEGTYNYFPIDNFIHGVDGERLVFDFAIFLCGICFHRPLSANNNIHILKYMHPLSALAFKEIFTFLMRPNYHLCFMINWCHNSEASR
ncbi:hypothetical protein ACJX0J_012592, partial [Zea mays]